MVLTTHVFFGETASQAHCESFLSFLGHPFYTFTAHGRVREQRVELYVISLHVLSRRPSAVHGCCTFHLSSLLRETAQPVTSAFAFLLMSTWAASASFLVILVVTERPLLPICPFAHVRAVL